MYKIEDVRRSEGRGKSWWRGGGSKENSERKQSSYFQSIAWLTGLQDNGAGFPHQES